METDDLLTGDADFPALEYKGALFSRGQIAVYADQICALLDAAQVPKDAAIGLIARNRPLHQAAILGLITQGRIASMIYAFQSPKMISADLLANRFAAVIADVEDWSAEAIEAAQSCGTLGVVLDSEMKNLIISGDQVPFVVVCGCLLVDLAAPRPCHFCVHCPGSTCSVAVHQEVLVQTLEDLYSASESQRSQRGGGVKETPRGNAGQKDSPRRQLVSEPADFSPEKAGINNFVRPQAGEKGAKPGKDGKPGGPGAIPAATAKGAAPPKRTQSGSAAERPAKGGPKQPEQQKPDVVSPRAKVGKAGAPKEDAGMYSQPETSPRGPATEPSPRGPGAGVGGDAFQKQLLQEARDAREAERLEPTVVLLAEILSNALRLEGKYVLCCFLSLLCLRVGVLSCVVNVVITDSRGGCISLVLTWAGTLGPLSSARGRGTCRCPWRPPARCLPPSNSTKSGPSALSMGSNLRSFPQTTRSGWRWASRRPASRANTPRPTCPPA